MGKQYKEEQKKCHANAGGRRIQKIQHSTDFNFLRILALRFKSKFLALIVVNHKLEYDICGNLGSHNGGYTRLPKICRLGFQLLPILLILTVQSYVIRIEINGF